ncbi:glycosyltransferase [Mycetocola sp.]|jgi:glycosyltransferase involved in cell wall biosynthesis|uniref:glycosyltransferase family 2 protein n=1 Tax=Mycetocola sp. TaxID=1871042 RepID=UPI002604CB41|nr:glycosyltransferase [Mycetocola sp.]MCU1420081.1 glycosyltransferase [Mycetocola sp.]MCU1559570.1 glycosyltransferase [Mycetocola sp.]
MPRLSVLMTARDSEATITSAVRSTLAALPDDAEVVVLDDGSTDGTLAALHRIADRRLVIRSSHHVGVANGLNRLLETTDSEFVGRMDADDRCLPGRFGRQVKAVQSDCDAVFTTVIDWWSDRRRIGFLPPVGIAVRAFPYYLLLTNPVSHPTLVARRSVVEGVGGYRAVPAEDYDLWLRLVNSGARLRRLALPGVLYRRHMTQVTASAAWRRQSWADETIGSAFGDLSQALLGERFMRLVTLASSDRLLAEEKDRILADFSARYMSAIAVLPAAERLVLARKCRARADWVRTVRDLPSATALP